MNYNSPPNDTAATNNGGDDRYDVYLKNIGAYGIYGWADPEGIVTATAAYSFIVIDNDYSQNECGTQHTPTEYLQVTAAHEFFHAIQASYRWTTENRWWMEASATWMEDEKYDDVNDYLQYLGEPYTDTNNNGQYDSGELFTDRNNNRWRDPGWFDCPQTPINTFNGWYEYGSCIFCKFLSEHRGGRGIIKEIWERCGTKDSLKAIEDELKERGYDFEDTFRDFAVANYTKDYEEGASYPDIRIATTYNSHPNGNQRLVEDYPPSVGTKINSIFFPRAEVKDLDHLASTYISFKRPAQLDEDTHIWIHFNGDGMGGDDY
jgi:hypothetical protein